MFARRRLGLNTVARPSVSCWRTSAFAGRCGKKRIDVVLFITWGWIKTIQNLYIKVIQYLYPLYIIMITSLISYFLLGRKSPLQAILLFTRVPSVWPITTLNSDPTAFIPASSKGCIFPVFSAKNVVSTQMQWSFFGCEHCFFPPLHVGQKCVHIYVSEIAFLPD